MNEKGYSLVFVLLTVTIFFILGLTILSVSIYQAKFTQVRIEDVESLHEAVKAIEETIAELKVKVENLDLSTPSQLDNDLGSAQSGFIKDLMDRHGVSIEDMTKENKIERNKLFTRVYVISKRYGNKTVSRQVIITNTPSFLKYAIGSREDVTLNGGSYIDGNIYAEKNFYVTNVANYIYNSQKYSEPTSFPTTSETSVLFVGGNRYACNHENGSCYSTANNRFERIMANYRLNEVTFEDQGPSLQKEYDEFIDVDFDWTFKDKLLNAAGIETFSKEYEANINKSSDQLLDELKNNFTVLDSTQSLFTSLSEMPSNQSILLESDEISSFFIESGEVDLENRWLIVNGDLFLGNSINKPVKIRGNILVFGNLTISGDVQFDSTIYVLNRTFIYNANISGWNDKQVVLLSKGPLEIARINEFQNNFSFDTPNLKGYFYTDSNAVLYAVGSYVNIKGGLFARGNPDETVSDADTSGLVINAYRGEAEAHSDSISFVPSENKEQSRFVVRHDYSIWIDRGLGLPFVNKLDLIVDKIKVE
ncbi:hypothetical protein EDD69_103165 [Thermolongibacillus altinsuensis]|uniref:Cytoskeletal protein CcmA (Bactofilin family) n=1 Tax=Thermolongibacillus altinsuensis TaxID=575256 RepID=A0A4R1QHB7_9BACL|nr:hypothetical protein [Thermolongibacillus altinsuensis]TCL51920.1 hypothetical protein EDD69_103165 [Thermolongibacillus altinsuensis]